MLIDGWATGLAEGRLRGIRTLLALSLVVMAVAALSTAASASGKHRSAAPTYSPKTGRVPSSERVRTTLHISNDTTVVPAPKKTVVRVSQRAALFAINHSSPFHVDGRTFYPSVLFGLVTNSVMQSACNIPGLLAPAQPSTTPTTACHKGLFYQGTPMWVVIQHGFCTQPIGGGASPLGATTTTTQPTTTTTTINPARCVLYTFVSAKTGKYLYAES
jgi:hypothetical protein